MIFLILFIIVNCDFIRYEDINITILDQISLNKLPYLLCQNITDGPNKPILQSTDDFLIPPMSTFILNNIPYGIEDCRTIFFYISYFRVKYNADPENIILYIMKDINSGFPGDIIFKKTFLTPLNGWNINYNNPGILLLSINVGDKDDNGNEFDIKSSSIYYGLKFWVSFIVTLKRNFVLTGYRENMFYWITYKKPEKLNINEQDSPYKIYNKTSQYYFIDKNNLLKKGLTSWTLANDTEIKLNINSTESSLNMAWKVDLLCKQTIHITTLSPQPTSITINPTPNTVIPNSKQPSLPPTDEIKENKHELFLFLGILIIVVVITCFSLTIIYYKRIFKSNEIIEIEHFMKDNKEKIEMNLYTEFKDDNENKKKVIIIDPNDVEVVY
jgi:hypothetical protein